MNSDKLTTLIGLGKALVLAAITFYTTSNQEGSVNLTNPVFWAGMAYALFTAYQGYYTNKPVVVPVPVKVP
jgi:hypothetical protein